MSVWHGATGAWSGRRPTCRVSTPVTGVLTRHVGLRPDHAPVAPCQTLMDDQPLIRRDHRSEESSQHAAAQASCARDTWAALYHDGRRILLAAGLSNLNQA